MSKNQFTAVMVDSSPRGLAPASGIVANGLAFGPAETSVR